MSTGEFNLGGNPAMDWHPIQGGVEILLVASCYWDQDKLRPDGPVGSHADFAFITYLNAQENRKSHHSWSYFTDQAHDLTESKLITGRKYGLLSASCLINLIDHAYSNKDCFANTNLLAVKAFPRWSFNVINSTENTPVKQPENEERWKVRIGCYYVQH